MTKCYGCWDANAFKNGVYIIALTFVQVIMFYVNVYIIILKLNPLSFGAGCVGVVERYALCLIMPFLVGNIHVAYVLFQPGLLFY